MPGQPGAPPPPPPYYTEPPPEPPPERRPIDEHRGFYLQLSLGGGYVSIKDEYTGTSTGTETIKGTGLITSAVLGGGVGAGIVVGGGVELFSGELEYNDTGDGDAGVFTDDTVDAGGASIFAMFQKYIGPVYLRGMLGGMSGGASSGDDYGGLLLGGGVGADFLLSTRWSLGGVLAFRYTSDHYNDFDGYTGDATMTVTSLEFAATLF